MHHRLQQKVFVGKKKRASLLQNSRASSTFTTSENPHLANNKLHSKSTYFYRWGSKTKLSSKFSYVIPTVCTLALLVGGIITINPSANNTNKVFANEPATHATSSITLTLDPAGGAADQVTNVPRIGEVAYRSNTFSVSQSSSSLFAVSIRAANGYTSDLVNTNNSNARISGVGNNVSEANFGENTWGYALTTNTGAANNTLSYNTVPENTDHSLAYAEKSTGANFKIVFAAKFGPDSPNGHYQTKVYLSAIANPTNVTSGFDSITNMQGMTPTICDQAYIGETKQLKDTRDSKTYWVTKLEDGNCWMTQNLAFNGGGTKQCELNGDTSCPGWPGVNNNDNVARYAVGTHTNGDHSSQGNFYSWEAAVNGSTNGGDGIQGVCPDGWQLPTSNNTDKTRKSFGGLTNAYGIGDNESGSTALRTDPLYFVYSGHIYHGSTYDASSAGYYWSSTPSSNSNYAHYLYLSNYAIKVGPSNEWFHYAGMSVRCIAQ